LVKKRYNIYKDKNINNSGLIAIKTKEDDDIIFVGLIEDVNKEEILIATHDGYCTRFLTDTIWAFMPLFFILLQ